MAKKKNKRAGKAPGTPAEGPIGRYVYCPRSNNGALHGLVAKQVTWSGKVYWFQCVCGLRAYWPRGPGGQPLFTQQQVIEAGALIPDELV